MIRAVLPKLLEKKNLTSEEVRGCFQEMMTGAVTDAQIGAFLMGLRQKGESLEEIESAVRTVREMAVRVDTPFQDLADTCGTGGDYSSTFNISTAAALIAAGAGAHVAKHGNRSASSQAGSADVLETLGVRIETSPEKTRKCLEETGFGFFFAPLYHPCLKFVAGPRRELGLRTIFNMIGPLVNPARVERQLLGVWDPNFLDLFAKVLQNLRARHVLIVSGGDGLDEITLSTVTEICEMKEGGLKRFRLDPKDLGFSYCEKKDLEGGDAATNAKIIEAVLKGEDSPRRDVSVLNAAAVLYVAGRAPDIKTGIDRADEAVDSGKAYQVLERLRKISTS